MCGGSYSRVEKMRGRRSQTSLREERSNDTGKKVVIAHGSVEFCEATPIDLADESKESLYGREMDQDLGNADLRSTSTCSRCVAWFFIFCPNEQRGVRGAGGGALPDFFFSFFLLGRPRTGLATV